MDLKQIRYFVAAADAGSFTRGARHAFISQPTLSAAIASLEAELRVRLLERTARGTSLTAEGRRALVHARAILHESEALRSAVLDAPAERPLRLGALRSAPPEWVASTLRRLGALTVGRTWRLEQAPLGALVQRLANGRYDAIVTMLRKPQRGLHQLEIGRDAQALAVRRGTRIAGAVTPALLDGRPLIVRTHCEQLTAASRILDAWKVRPLVVARTDSDAHALALVSAGIGACLIPDSFSHEGVDLLRPRGVDLRRRIGLEWIRGAADGALADLR